VKVSSEEKKKDLILRKSRLEAQIKRLENADRKKQTSRKIELGGLIIKARVNDLNNNALLGALLEVQEKMKEDSTVKKWKDKGDAAFKKAKKENGEKLILTFDMEPSREVKNKLKDLKFSWKSFRKEWWGHGQREIVERELKGFEFDLEVVE